ncbi:MAG: VacB/RNase II family 3'-5' exoribonuclease [Chlamydiota bacterium]
MKHEQHYKNCLLQYFTGKQGHPSTQEELFQTLTIPKAHKKFFQKALAELVTEGELVAISEKYLLAKDKDRLTRGIIRMHARGFGFVSTPSYDQDVFIPKHLTLNSIDSDTVEILVDSEISAKGPEGRVLAILERGRRHIAGTIWQESPAGLLAYAPLLGKQKRIVLKDASEFHVGDRLIMSVIDWGSIDSPVIATPVHKIGSINEPKHDIPAAIEEFGLRQEFPAEVIAEARAFGDAVQEIDIKNRKDLRKLETLTIDPDTAKDYDDALSLKKTASGYTLWVHIADVSHYVKPGSALDNEAKARCNSVYFPGFCLPMLPHELSSHLCSLKEKVDRLACTIEMHFDETGELLEAHPYHSVINSCKRFTYKQAKSVLDGKLESPFKDSLELMVEFCLLLKKKRAERGSVEFGMAEVVMMVDPDGIPQGFERVEYDITHQLVEEFMLKANETVATLLTKRGTPVAYRVHEEPSADSLKEFAQLARAFGFKLSETPTPVDLQKLFDEATQTPFGPQLAVSFIRSMRLAYYSPSALGHYGLSLPYYTHFTSPIRRYIDLVIHRLLMEKEAPETLEEIAHTCSEQERISAKAETSVVILKKFRYLQKLQEEDPACAFEAIVSRVKPMGIIFDIPSLMLDGFIHVSDLGDDYYVYHEALHKMQGRHTGHTYACGTKFEVQLSQVDFITLESKWELKGGKAARRPRGSKNK